MLITDPNSYLVYYGLPITTVAWLAAIRVRAVMVLQLMLSLELSLGVYFMLNIYNDQMFPTGSLTMAGVVFALSGLLLAVVYCGAGVLLYLACLTVVVPIFKYNGQLVADKLHLPSQWGGIVVLVILLLILAGLIIASNVLSFAGLVLKVLATTLLFVMVVRITYMEQRDGDDSKTFVCAGVEDDALHPHRCPLVIDVTWAVIFVICLVAQVTMILTCRCKKKKKKKTKETVATKRGPPRSKREIAAAASQTSPRVASPVYSAAVASITRTDEPGEEEEEAARVSSGEEDAYSDEDVKAAVRSAKSGMCSTLRRRTAETQAEGVQRLDGH